MRDLASMALQKSESPLPGELWSGVVEYLILAPKQIQTMRGYSFLHSSQNLNSNLSDRSGDQCYCCNTATGVVICACNGTDNLKHTPSL